MAVPDVHPIRGTAGTARGAGTDRSNERLDLADRLLRVGSGLCVSTWLLGAGIKEVIQKRPSSNPGSL